jgi:hypothetical protein
MDINELANELAMLKEENAAAKEQQRFGGFIDKYGTQFNGDTGIANIILAEMDRRGVDSASEAASEAVQSVLDQLREEATRVLDATKGAMQQINDLVGQIDDVQAAVEAAVPAPGMPGEMMPGEGMVPGMEGDPALEGAPPMEMPGATPDASAPPDMGGAPPEAGPPAGGGEISGDTGGAPPEAPPMEEPPPEEVPSDVRIKNIRARIAAFKKTPAPATVVSDQQVKTVQQPMWRPNKNMLAGLRGGVV